MTAGVPESERETSNDEYHHASRILAGRGLKKKAKTAGLDSKVSLLSSVARSVLPVHAGDVRNMITGFLQDDCMESSATGGNDLWDSCELSWIPLQNGEAVLMMHDVTVQQVDHGQDQRPWLWKRTTSSSWVCADCMVVPAWAVLAVLLCADDVRAACVST